MSLSELECSCTIALHRISVRQITSLHGCVYMVLLHLVMNCVGSGMGQSLIESHSVNENGKRIVSGVASKGYTPPLSEKPENRVRQRIHR